MRFVFPNILVGNAFPLLLIYQGYFSNFRSYIFFFYKHKKWKNFAMCHSVCSLLLLLLLFFITNLLFTYKKSLQNVVKRDVQNERQPLWNAAF